MEKCLQNTPQEQNATRCLKKSAPTRPQDEDLGALKIQKIRCLKKMPPESIFELGKRHLAAQAPTVGFGG